LLDESYIQIALELAKKGKGSVSPMPLSGVILVKNNKIVSAAFRSSPSEEPAEVTAINNAKDSADGASLYTNIEPCSFYEKDDSCVDFLIQSKIKEIFIGAVNPHPQNGGAAFKKLKKAGINIKTGILEKECIELNKFYFKYCLSGIPYITLKMAMTLDGRIADSFNKSKWITSVESRSLVHEFRSEYDAVLVGINTVKIDNPKLNVRLVEGRNPKRIVLDPRLEINSASYLIKNNSDKNLVVVTSKKNKSKRKKLDKLYEYGAEVVFASEKKDGRLNLVNVLKKLGELKIVSIFVEGGGKIFSGFSKNKLEDEIIIFIGPKILGSGIPLVSRFDIKSLSKADSYIIKDIDKIGDDALLRLVRR
jgi:diaminohydroxyphosphoribosylaminopyrimidine deaminase / 5-amino-6-(5-phosphoribosylamino)uracil reductase